MSGLKVNIDKTNAVWIGSNKGRKKGICEHIKVNWVLAENFFRALGIDFNTKNGEFELHYWSFLLLRV